MGRYPFGSWRGDGGQPVAQIQGGEDGVWPVELTDIEDYTRAGKGDLGAGDLDDPQAEHRRSDFYELRDFRLDRGRTLGDLARCYKYWIALTDCDGFRIDTLKHVSFDEAHRFCGSIKEFAANLGKSDFFLVGEVAGGDYNEDRYLDVIGMNLNAALDIGEMRMSLNGVAKGLDAPSRYFNGFDPGNAVMGSHRSLGRRHVSILDDHDHVFGDKMRFSSEAGLRSSGRGGGYPATLHTWHSLHLLRDRTGAGRPRIFGAHVAAGLGAVGSLSARGDVRSRAPTKTRKGRFGPAS